MSDVEILKALKICTADKGCKGCSYYELGSSSCLEQVCKDAAELIEKQRAEIERLQNQIILKNNALLNVTYVAKRIPQTICDHCVPDFNRNDEPVNVWKAQEGYKAIDALVEQIVKEVMV